MSLQPSKANLKDIITLYLRKFIGTRVNYETQREAFVDATNFLVIIGQFIGVFPIQDIEKRHKSKSIFRIISWRYIFCIIMCKWQLLATILCFCNLFTSPVTITKFAFVTFYLTTFISSVLFMRLASNWPYLLEQLGTVKLNEYTDPFIKFKCNFAAVIIVGLALVEHVLSITVKWTTFGTCWSDSNYTFEQYILRNFYWLYEFNVPYSTVLGTYLLVINIFSTINWSYLHLFVICISLYLSSILEQLNKAIESRNGQCHWGKYRDPKSDLYNPEEQIMIANRHKEHTHSVLTGNLEYLPPRYWRKLREDYNRASRLVRCFDDAINGVLFLSFASNLFFVCLQLYYILVNGVKVQQCDNFVNVKKNSNQESRIFFAYVYIGFAIYSLAFVLLRSLAVALIAARVHTASLAPLPSLYSVPPPTYCIEVQRFIDQMHGDTIALTGLNFFYITKELILSVVGTIVTYELVLLQLDK